MKLDDIKKLKVPELRSKLKELGLDAKGLKAELITRLWSASEARACEEAVQEKLQQNDTGSDDGISMTQTITPDTPAASAAPPEEEEEEEEEEAAGKMDRCKEFRDSATQTETPHSDVSAAQRHSQPTPAGAPAAPEGDGEVDMQQGGGEDGEDGEDGEEPGRAQPSDDRGRGRAFYEFKEEIRYKRAKSPQPAVPIDHTHAPDGDQVELNPHDSHLHFQVDPDCSCGQPRFWDRFPLLWSGCRLTHGVVQGRVGFEVRVERTLSATQPDDNDDKHPQGVRLGWSTPDTSLLLGQDQLSFAYDGRGVRVSGGTEEEFGEAFAAGDIIGCYASLSTDAAEITFHKNGRSMGAAFSFSSPALLGRPLFPHVLCKGCSVQFHLDPTAPPWYPGPSGFSALVALPPGRLARSTFTPKPRGQCEVLLMVGLPGSGKSHWARTHMKQHPDKQYRLLGTEELLSCMITGGQRQHQLQQAAQCLTDVIKLAAQTPGNYILDQCNVLFSARRYKLQLFAGFRRTVSVVFPSADEWKRRLSERRTGDGEQIPETALLKQQVSCSLPEQQSDLLEELLYVELPQEQAQELLRRYKDQAQRLLPPIPKPEKRRPKVQKKRPYAHGRPLPRRVQWASCPGWNETRLNLQTSRQHLRYWNVAYQDPGYYYRDFTDGGW